MGIESRDWYRNNARRRRSRSGLSRTELTVFLVIVGALVLALSPPVRERLGYELPLGLESVFRRDTTPGALRLQLLPAGPNLTLREVPLYAPNDPWRAWLADEPTCPRGEDALAPLRIQVQVMLCLVNFARRREELPALTLSPTLNMAAAAKASDIVRCGRFEHEACGRPSDEAARRLGHQGAFGENLYLAQGPLTAPRVALDGWLNSEGHRENLFRPEWRSIGIALLPGADVERFRGGVVWVQQFGD